jgi:hypothetical protein
LGCSAQVFGIACALTKAPNEGDLDGIA